MTAEMINRTIDNLRLNNMDGYFVNSREQLFELLDKLIPLGSTVGHGGSVTLDEVGVTDWLRKREVTFLDRAKAADPSECMRQSMVADVYMCSTNAITEAGELYNVDGRGNRVSAMIYGPKSVIVIAGINKLVANLEQAVSRVECTAAPLNAARLSMNTPCAATGRCGHCHSADRICCNYVVMAQQREKGRIKVIVLDEKLGY